MRNLSTRASSLSSSIDIDSVFSKDYLASYSFKSGSSGTNASNAYFSLAFLISIAFYASLVPLLSLEMGELGLELFGEVFKTN